jgi:hypothetical protein
MRKYEDEDRPEFDPPEKMNEEEKDVEDYEEDLDWLRRNPL